MPNSSAGNLKLSNLALIAVIFILGVGILLDGALYNKSPQQPGIHQIDDARSVTALINNQPIVSLNKKGDYWYQTYPVSAPAQALRVEPLLNTNKHSQRSYLLDEVPHEEIFKKPVILKINNFEYQLGSIEPVSKLRYVRSGDHVYLQPDSVLPMLGAAETVFVDLKITNEVDNITIGNTAVESSAAWSNLNALGIIDAESSELNKNSIEIRLTDDNAPRILHAAKADVGITITNEQGFTFLVSDSIAETLGLTDYLP